MPPHIFSISDNAYNDMLRERHNQSMLITGKFSSRLDIFRAKSIKINYSSKILFHKIDFFDLKYIQNEIR